MTYYKKQSFEEIQKDKKQSDENYYHISLYLADQAENKEWKSKGYKTFYRFAGKELQLKEYKTKILLAIGRKLKELQIPFSKIESIDWEKFKLICSIINAENMDEWFEKADKFTYDYLKQQVKEYKDKNTPPGTKKRLVFSVTKEEKDVIDMALKTFNKVNNSKFSMGSFIGCIALEYISNLRNKV